MIDLDGPRERAPSRLPLIRAGVLYVADLELVTRLLRECEIKASFAGIGPKLYFGRKSGPWTVLDLGVVDQNEGKPVRDRSWPWCAGDEIWTVAVWQSLPIYLHFIDDHEIELVLVLAVDGEISVKNLIELARERAHERTHGLAQAIDFAIPPV